MPVRVKPRVWLAPIVLTALLGPRAIACECGELPTFEQARAEASVVFEGRSVRSHGAPEESTRVVLEVTQSFIGEVREQVEVLVPEGCPGALARPGFVLVYATRDDDGRLRVDPCGRTAALESELATSDRAALGAGTIPVDVEDHDVPALPTHPDRAGCQSCAVTQRGGGPAPWLASLILVLVVRRRR